MHCEISHGRDIFKALYNNVIIIHIMLHQGHSIQASSRAHHTQNHTTSIINLNHFIKHLPNCINIKSKQLTKWGDSYTPKSQALSLPLSSLLGPLLSY